MKKRKIKISWTCSDYVDHIHKTKFGAWFCGRKQYVLKRIVQYLLEKTRDD